MRSIEKNLSNFAAVGVHPVAISVDPPQVSLDLQKSAGYRFTFLSDPSAEAIRHYDLVHKGAGEHGEDISRPAEFLVDANGTVRWLNLTKNYWVRPRVEQMLAEANKLK